MGPESYFGFNINDFYDQKNESLILLSKDDPNVMVIFALCDQHANMVIYYDSMEDWAYQILPKDEVRKLYLDFRANGYEPCKK